MSCEQRDFLEGRVCALDEEPPTFVGDERLVVVVLTSAFYGVFG